MKKELKQDIFSPYRTSIKEEKVYQKEVKSAQRDVKYGDVAVVYFNDVKGIIEKKESDLDVEWNSLVNFVGKKIELVIIGVDEELGVLLCSRKKAQEIIKPKLVSILSKNEVIKGKIVKFVQFGAYIEIMGVTGLLKNVDFSSDHTAVQDVFKIGQDVDVKLLRFTKDKGKIFFESEKKYKKEEVPNLEKFAVDDVTSGVVVGIKDWGIYVRLLPGIDALCPPPKEEEAILGTRVIIKLTQLKDNNNELKIRGKYIKTLSS